MIIDHTHTHAHTHTQPFYSPLGFYPGLRGWAGTRKVKPGRYKTNLDLLEQEIVSGSGISWAICKSAPWPRYITMPASHHSVFYSLDAFPATQPAASKHWRHVYALCTHITRKLCGRTSPNFLCMLPVAMAQSSSDSIVCMDDVMFSYYGTYQWTDGHSVVY